MAGARVAEVALERLLDACVGLELLRHTAAGYENTPVAATYLTQTSPRRLTGYLGFSNDAMWKLWSHLEDAVREGTHRWRQTYGWDGPIFSHFFKEEGTKREFLMGMHGFGLISSPHVASAFDLSGYRTFVDLGGATGHLAIAACERWSNLRGVVFDLEDAMPLAREIVGASRMKDRVQLVAGDFFDVSAPLRSLGLDSLMALEIRNRLQERAGVTVSLVTLIQGPSIADLAETLVEHLDRVAPAAKEAASADPGGASVDVQQLSDESVDALLRQMLAER